jgi:hypothetical protein
MIFMENSLCIEKGVLFVMFFDSSSCPNFIVDCGLLLKGSQRIVQIVYKNNETAYTLCGKLDSFYVVFGPIVK